MFLGWLDKKRIVSILHDADLTGIFELSRKTKIDFTSKSSNLPQYGIPHVDN